MTLQPNTNLNEVCAIKVALSEPPDDMKVRCIGCRPVVEALLLIRELERKLSDDSRPQANRLACLNLDVRRAPKSLPGVVDRNIAAR